MITIPPSRAAELLVDHVGLGTYEDWSESSSRDVLGRLRCIQLDPLDPIGTNQDMVVGARVDGVGRGELYKDIFAAGAFEHFAKERCLLPAAAFPYYRDRLAGGHWWRGAERARRLPDGVVEDVLAEVRDRGPLSAAELSDRGRVKPIDWSGWKGTRKAGTMALEVLWSRCDIVVAGRRGREKVYDLPERALGEVAAARPAMSFARWALLERAQAAGMLSRATGPQWSMLREARDLRLADDLVAEGLLEDCRIEGSRRAYLAPKGFCERQTPEPDDRVRVLGPLDHLVWDRKLIGLAFDFDYIWEVYKPAARRRYGWYVHPILHRGALVGRLEAVVKDGKLQTLNVWEQSRGSVDRAGLQAWAQRHAARCGAKATGLPRFRLSR